MDASSLTRSVWAVEADEFPMDAPIEDQARFLLRYAILAPSSHNAQPWRFDVTRNVIEVRADEDRRWSIGELQFEADQELMDDSDYRRELGYWLGIGALGDSWLVARVGQTVVTHLDLGDREGQKNSTLIRSAPVVGVLVTATDEPAVWVRAGQTFQRLALVATAEGVVVHPMSQTLERPEYRDRLADCLGIEDGIPQHLFRLGYADEERAHTPRWPLDTFLSTP